MYSVSVVPGTSTDTAKLGNSKMWGNDIGLCRWGPGTQGNWVSARDDLTQAIQQATNGAVTSLGQADDYNNNFYLDQLYHTIMARNNSNVGVLCRAYYVQPRYAKSNAVSSDASTFALPRILSDMDESYTAAPSPLLIQDERMGISTTLFDYPNVCRNWKIKLFKKGIIFPGQTVMFKLGTPAAGKTHSIPLITQTVSDPLFHRALILQFSGLLGHDSTQADFVSGPVQFSKYKVDIIVHKHLKVRVVSASEAILEDLRATMTTDIPAIAGNLEVMPAVKPTNVNQGS